MPTLDQNNVEVHVSTTADTSGLDQTRRSADQLESTAKGSRVGSYFKENFAAAGVAAGGLVLSLGAATGAAIVQTGALEGQRAAFETMLKSGEKASALMNQISKFAAETPFEFPELADAGKKLLAYGFQQEQVIGTMRRLGDVASGLGIPLGELTDIYGKARTQGTLFTEDFDQFTGRGIPLAQALSGVMGVSADKVRGLASEGKITFDVLQKGFEVLTDKGGQFAGGMDKQSKTLNGLLSTVSDNVGQTIRMFLGVDNGGNIRDGSIFAMAKDGINSFLPALAALQPKLVAFGEWFTSSKLAMGAFGGILLGLVGGAIAAAIAAFGSVLGVLATFAAAGIAAGALINFLVGKFGGWGVVLGKVREGLGFVKDALTLLYTGDFKGGMLGGVEEDSAIVDKLFDIREGAQALANIMRDQLAVAGGLILKAFELLKPSFALLGNTITSQLFPALQNLWNLLSPQLLPTLQVFAAILGGAVFAAIWLVTNALTVVIGVISFVINAYVALEKTILSAFGKMVEGITYFKNHFFESIGFVIGFFATLPIKLVALTWQAVGGMIGVLGSINWGGVAGSIGNAFVGMWNSVKANAVGAFNFIMGINWGAILTGIGKGVGNAIIGLIEGALNGALAGIPGAPKFRIPRFANGVQDFGGGLALVGERGPELVSLPGGSNVYTNEQSRGMMAGGGGTTINGNIYLGDETAVDRFFNRIGRGQDLAGMGVATYGN